VATVVQASREVDGGTPQVVEVLVGANVSKLMSVSSPTTMSTFTGGRTKTHKDTELSCHGEA
jgi:hypothetical protein